MIPAPFDRSKVPHKPGIYQFYDRRGKLLYVGKAIDLHSRVSSYFAGHQNSFKTAKLVEEIADIKTIIVESELEALVLEANLIKRYKPPFNIKLTDDKDYLYIKITKGDFPQVVTARKAELQDAKKYFGPFPSSRTVRDTLKKLRRIFPWCANPPKKINTQDVNKISARHPRPVRQLAEGSINNTVTRIPASAGMTVVRSRNDMAHNSLPIARRPCFYYHLKLCPGACTGAVSPKEYQKNIRNLSLFLEGRKDTLFRKLEGEMGMASKHQEFEQAQKLKKMIEGLQYLVQPNRTSVYLENPNFLEDQRIIGLKQLQMDLNLPQLPERIECYDISNTQGNEATGSLTVMTNGEIDKRWYRKFKIKITGRPNDVGMHKEMMRRRLNHPEWPLPDLIIIDGGRGQVRGSHEELVKKGYSDIPIFGLAKQFEWLYPPEGEIVKIPKRSLSLRLLQKLRDEAHRFAISYHKKLRSAAFFGR